MKKKRSAQIDAWRAWTQAEREERMRGRITLPKISSPYRPIFRGEKRRALIDAVMDQMRDWRLSPFENEAATLHGLRSGLCLDAHGWQRSDLEAYLLVSEALRLLGAVRPSHEEGQRQYTIPRENCLWCNTPLSEVDRLTPGQRFCSAEHARFHLVYRDHDEQFRKSALENSAYSLIRREKRPPVTCAYAACGKVFHPAVEGSRYCSQRCAQRDKPRALRPRLCPGCDKTFTPKYGAQKFCSSTCNAKVRTERRRREAALRPCPNCLRYFRPASHNTAFCCQECQREMFNAFRREARRTGAGIARIPVKAILAAPISPMLFDVLWTRHHRTAAPRGMTPALFDRLFREAA